MLKPEKILELYDIPVMDRAILLFQSFPGKMTYFEEIFETLKNIQKGIFFSYTAENIYVVEIYTVGIGTFRMYWEEIDLITKQVGYRFSFSLLDETTKMFTSPGYEKVDADIISSRALPFMVSKGHYKESIPLIIHDFPEFAKFALEYTP